METDKLILVRWAKPNIWNWLKYVNYKTVLINNLYSNLLLLGLLIRDKSDKCAA